VSRTAGDVEVLAARRQRQVTTGHILAFHQALFLLVLLADVRDILQHLCECECESCFIERFAEQIQCVSAQRENFAADLVDDLPLLFCQLDELWLSYFGALKHDGALDVGRGICLAPARAAGVAGSWLGGLRSEVFEQFVVAEIIARALVGLRPRRLLKRVCVREGQ
jgi:hypothetical protein